MFWLMKSLLLLLLLTIFLLLLFISDWIGTGDIVYGNGNNLTKERKVSLFCFFLFLFICHKNRNREKSKIMFEDAVSNHQFVLKCTCESRASVFIVIEIGAIEDKIEATSVPIVLTTYMRLVS